MVMSGVEKERMAGASKKAIIGAIAFLVIVELLIYTIAASTSGTEYRVIIEDREGHVLYETPGKHLTRYEELSFQNRYGPVENYIVRVVTQERSFPFRAWLAASVGIPIGAVLILAFLIRGYMAIFDTNRGDTYTGLDDKTIFASPSSKPSFIGWIQSLSLFHLGAVVIILLIAFWIIPNAVSEAAAKVVYFMEHHPVICSGFFIFVAGIVVWVIYLRYKLSREIVRYQFELAKMRLERASLPDLKEADEPKLLENHLPPEPKDVSDERRKHHGMV
jgi:hypothetical protein